MGNVEGRGTVDIRLEALAMASGIVLIVVSGVGAVEGGHEQRAETGLSIPRKMLPQSAAIFALQQINHSIAGRKVRVAGRQVQPSSAPHGFNRSRMVAYNVHTHQLVLAEGASGLFVDVSLCLRAQSPFLRETKSKLMVIGYLEELEVRAHSSISNSIRQIRQTPAPMPAISPHLPRVSVDATLVLRAVLVRQADDLDLTTWNEAAATRHVP